MSNRYLRSHGYVCFCLLTASILSGCSDPKISVKSQTPEIPEVAASPNMQSVALQGQREATKRYWTIIAVVASEVGKLPAKDDHTRSGSGHKEILAFYDNAASKFATASVKDVHPSVVKLGKQCVSTFHTMSSFVEELSVFEKDNAEFSATSSSWQNLAMSGFRGFFGDPLGQIDRMEKQRDALLIRAAELQRKRAHALSLLRILQSDQITVRQDVYRDLQIELGEIKNNEYSSNEK